MSFKERKIFIFAIVLSLLLHILFFLLFKFEYLFKIEEAAAAEPDPIVLELEQPPPPPETRPEQEKRPEKFFRIVENPNASGEEPEESDMISTESSLAQSPRRSDEPMREIAGKDVDKPKETRQKRETGEDKTAQKTPETDPDGLLAYRQPVFSREALSKKTDHPPAEEEQRGEADHDMQYFKGDLIGGISLNTYAWPYAGFLLEFKRKLFRVWTIPSAYTHLGLISGHTIARAHISKKGVLTRLDVLEHVGHESLKTSSINALDSTFPLIPLPSAFPEEELVLTIKLIYPDLRAIQNVN